jgi:hypothetical protein
VGGLQELTSLVSHLDVFHPPYFDGSPKVILHDPAQRFDDRPFAQGHLRESLEMHDPELHEAIDRKILHSIPPPFIKDPIFVLTPISPLTPTLSPNPGGEGRVRGSESSILFRDD